LNGGHELALGFGCLSPRLIELADPDENSVERNDVHHYRRHGLVDHVTRVTRSKLVFAPTVARDRVEPDKDAVLCRLKRENGTRL
jgi:hypothetical protein